MTRSTMREHIFKLLFRAPFIDNKDEYEEQINLYFADADLVAASHLKEEEYTYIKNKTLAIAELIPELDEKIDSVSEGWPTSRLGKTELSIALAKAVNGEIISADSMQVYRHMDIGSAKVTKEEMDGVSMLDFDDTEDHYHDMEALLSVTFDEEADTEATQQKLQEI